MSGRDTYRTDTKSASSFVVECANTTLSQHARIQRGLYLYKRRGIWTSAKGPTKRLYNRHAYMLCTLHKHQIYLFTRTSKRSQTCGTIKKLSIFVCHASHTVTQRLSVYLIRALFLHWSIVVMPVNEVYGCFFLVFFCCCFFTFFFLHFFNCISHF